TYTQSCSACHEPDRDAIPAWAELGMERLTATVRNGRGEMPSFEPEAVSDANLKLIAAYFRDPSAGAIPPGTAEAAPARGGGGPARPEGLRNFSGPFGAQWLSNNG